jgi:hypothetical protein
MSLMPQQAARLAKLVALLGSDAEGERHAALAAATRILNGIGRSWTDVAQHIGADAAPPVRLVVTEWRTAALRDHQHIAREMLRQGGAALTNWDRNFLQSLGDLARPLTPRQHAKLCEILNRVSTRAGGKTYAKAAQ